MRFDVLSPSSTGAIKIDWDAPVARTPEIRAAMAPHEVDELHAGVLLRGFAVGGVTYPRGSIAFRVAEGHELFLEIPFEEPVAVPREHVPTATVCEEVAAARHRVTVGDDLAGDRLDVILASAIPALSRAVVRRCIDDGLVTLGGQRIAKASARPRAGEVIELVVPGAKIG